MRRYMTSLLAGIVLAIVFFACKVRLSVGESSSIASTDAIDSINSDQTVHFTCSAGNTPYVRTLDFYMNLKTFEYYLFDDSTKTNNTAVKMRGVGAFKVYFTPAATGVEVVTANYIADTYSLSIGKGVNQTILFTNASIAGNGVVYSNCKSLTPHLVAFDIK